MKIIFIILVLLSYLNADEMQRIEAIVNDITELRIDYEECKTELKAEKRAAKSADVYTCQKHRDEVVKYKNLYKEEKKKNIILKAETDYNSDLIKSNKSLAKSVKTLEKQIKTQKILSIAKDNEIKKLSKKTKNTTPKKIVSSEICKDTNKFPKLMMKEKKKENKIEKKKLIKKDKIISFKARPFRIKADSAVYDSIDGKKIDEWKKGTSFTSNQKTEIWVKITGYFIDKKWKKSKKDMWIKKSQVSQR